MKHIFAASLVFLVMSATSLWAQYESPGLGPDVNFRSMYKAERPWKLWLRASIGHDDNVQEIGQATFFRGDTGSAFVGLTAEGSAWVKADAFLAGVALRFDQLYYLADQQDPAPAGFFSTDANDFDFTIINPALFVAYRIDKAPVPLTLRAGYDFRYEDAETEGGKFHTVSTGIGADLTSAWTADLTYAHGWDDHGVIYAFGHNLNDRDGQRDSLTLSTGYTFNERRTRLILLYGFLRNDTDGQNFSYEGNRISVRLESVLVGPLFGALQFGYERRDYHNGFTTFNPLIPAPGRTDMDLYVFGAQLLWKLNQHWAVDAFYNFTSYQTNVALFDSNRHVIGMGIRYDF